MAKKKVNDMAIKELYEALDALIASGALTPELNAMANEAAWLEATGRFIEATDVVADILYLAGVVA